MAITIEWFVAAECADGKYHHAHWVHHDPFTTEEQAVTALAAARSHDDSSWLAVMQRITVHEVTEIILPKTVESH